MSLSWWHETNIIQELPCFPFKLMEPYAVIHVDNNLIYYNEKFFNYGYNKVQHILKLRTSGYQFKVVTGVFSFDAPHLPYDYIVVFIHSSNMSVQYEGNYKYVSRMVWNDFLSNISKKELENNVCNKTFALQYFPTMF